MENVKEWIEIIQTKIIRIDYSLDYEVLQLLTEKGFTLNWENIVKMVRQNKFKTYQVQFIDFLLHKIKDENIEYVENTDNNDFFINREKKQLLCFNDYPFGDDIIFIEGEKYEEIIIKRN